MIPKTLKIALQTTFVFFLMLYSHNANADYIQPVFTQENTPRVYTAQYAGQIFKNRQIQGSEFCGGNEYAYENITVIHDNTGNDGSWYASTTDSTNYSNPFNFQDFVSLHGAGRYLFTAVNALACSGVEQIDGTAWALVDLDINGNATFLSDPEANNTNYTPSNSKEYVHFVSPEYGTTTGNDVTVVVHFETPLTLDIRPTTTRTVVIKDAVSNEILRISTSTLDENSAENKNENFTFHLQNGSKIAQAFYTLENGSVYSNIDTLFFNVNTNTYLESTGLNDPKTNASTLTQINCSIYDVGCQMQKVLMFLFYPSKDILDKFSNIWEKLSTKKPFGYVTMTIKQLQNLDTNSIHSFDLGDIPFKTSIFDPMKIALGSILWAVYAIYFYHRRLKTLDI